MLSAIRYIFRLSYAFFILARHGAFDTLILILKQKKISLFSRFIVSCTKIGWYKKDLGTAIEKLGPSYVKLGQFLATRPDIIPHSLCIALQNLQDKMQPFETKIAIALIEKEFEAPLTSRYILFSDPIAAASIAQVHFATLKTGEEVAVKVLRPNIKERFNKDIAAFYFAAKILQFFSSTAKRLRLKDVVKTFADCVKMELDLRMEGAAASEFLEENPCPDLCTIPKVYWQHTTHSILTIERLKAIPLTDIRALKKSHHNLHLVAQNVLKMFLIHVTSKGFFHGDMHQGNLFLMPDGKIGMIDFGVMGRLDYDSKHYLAEILYGFIKKDYKRIADVHFQAGYVPLHHSPALFAQAMRAIGEPLFGLSAKDMSIGKVLGQLFLTTEHFDMQTQTQLILLQKTMVTVEGVARSLDADANMWLAMRPVLEDWVKSNIGIKGITIDKWRKLQSFLNDAQDILTKGQDIIQHLHEQQFKMK